MPGRRSSRKKLKLKLKKNTVYSIFAFACFAACGVMLFSYLSHGESALQIHRMLSDRFGSYSFLFPLLFFFIGFLFMHLKKFYLSRLNVTIGYALIFVSVIGL